MAGEPIDAPSVPAASGGYAQALRVEGTSQLVFVSGQIPVAQDGVVPEPFEDQCRLVWAHILSLVDEAGADVNDIVKVTTFLAERTHADLNGAIRREMLGSHEPALTVVVAQLLDPAWKLEIEALVAR